MDVTLPGQPIVDKAGQTVGYVDAMRLGQGRLHVSGWAQAERLRLVFAGTETEAAPNLRREDVASALGLSENVGFNLLLPATLDMLLNSAPPGLVVTPRPDHAPIHPISLSVRLPLRLRARLMATFLRDVMAAIPAIAGWQLTGNPVFRKRVKARLRLDPPQPCGMLDPRLLPDARVPPDPDFAPHVDIVLPVYNAFDLLRDCLDRVERHTDLPWRLILIEDGSTDARVRPFLRDWAAGRDRVELLENPQNMGFIASVNRGLARAMQGDLPQTGPVVLLNSDALVPQGWARRLVWPFRGAPDVATVTPMSNDAEIFSVPAICCRTVLAAGQGEAIDAAARRLTCEAPLPEAPTGVGFCMAMGRRWLAQVPELDTAFGRGYGEEVDWCQKVARRGGRHLALPGLFVEHRGGESFGSEEKHALVLHNNRIVSRRYPDYDQSVQNFIVTDPLLTVRLGLGLAWAGSLDAARAVPVYLAHSMGGGADHWLEHRMAADLEEGRPSVVLRVGGMRRWQLELVTPQGRIIGQSDTVGMMRDLLAVLPRRHVIYSCAVGDPDPVEIPEILLSLLREGDRATILFHDYFPLSPSYTLLDKDGVYRGPVRPPRPDPAHAVRRPDGRRVPLEDWQAAWAGFAARADLAVFSNSSALQVAAVWPDLKDRIHLRPHGLRHAVPRLNLPAADAPPLLAVLGNIGRQKGAGLVQSLARRRARDGTGPRLVLIGNIDPAFDLPDSIALHGSYMVSDLPHLVSQYGVTHWLIPSIWPETFCYTVHEALATGLPVLAFGLGAQGDAVRAAENGIEMPFDAKADLAQTVRRTFEQIQDQQDIRQEA
jgi:GT2 family glycosyltransferase